MKNLTCCTLPDIKVMSMPDDASAARFVCLLFSLGLQIEFLKPYVYLLSTCNLGSQNLINIKHCVVYTLIVEKCKPVLAMERALILFMLKPKDCRKHILELL